MPTVTCTAEPNLKVLSQAVGLLARVDDDILARTCALAPGGSIGKHLRHCLDFYDCFLRGLSSGRVDYTHRDRDEEVETRRSVALRHLTEILRRLEALETGTHRTLLVREEEAPGGGEGGWSGSTVQRELQFLLSHTIHHFALVGMFLRFFGLSPEAEFGLAPSTLRHRREMENCLTS
ncbi:MAG: hypothetical protein L0170_15105 [Acidobacteria bacterium]|nr:hypothetical protein [Acidobacteriota bacterium]